MFNDADFEIGLASDAGSSLLPTPPDFGNVTLDFCILSVKEASATSQSGQQV